MLGSILTVRYQNERYLGSWGSSSDHMLGPWVPIEAWQCPVSHGWSVSALPGWWSDWCHQLVRLFPWPGFNVALCTTVVTAEPHTDGPGTDWFPNPGLGGDPLETMHQLIRRVSRCCREYNQAPGHTHCWDIWVVGKIGFDIEFSPQRPLFKGVPIL